MAADYRRYIPRERKKNSDKLIILEEIDVQLKIMKILIRVAYDTKALDGKKYIMLQKSMIEIGKMTGGWIKHIRTATQNRA